MDGCRARIAAIGRSLGAVAWLALATTACARGVGSLADDARSVDAPAVPGVRDAAGPPGDARSPSPDASPAPGDAATPDARPPDASVAVDAAPPPDAAGGPFCMKNVDCTTAGECCFVALCVPGTAIGNDLCVPN